MASGGLNLTYGRGGVYDGFDRFGQSVDYIWETDAESILDGYHYDFDAIGNRTSKDNMIAPTSLNLDKKYAYLVLNRGVDRVSNQSKIPDPFEFLTNLHRVLSDKEY